MTYVVAITDTKTGVRRESEFDLEWSDTHEYLWSDGNYGCDCNRAMWFAEAAGEEDQDVPCNPWPEPNRFLVSIRAGDRIVYEETP